MVEYFVEIYNDMGHLICKSSPKGPRTWNSRDQIEDFAYAKIKNKLITAVDGSGFYTRHWFLKTGLNKRFTYNLLDGNIIHLHYDIPSVNEVDLHLYQIV